MSIRLLFLGGVWPLNDSWLFRAYGAIIFSMGLATCVDGALAVYFIWRQMEETTLVLSNTFTIGSGVMKMGLFVRDRKLYSALVRRLDALVSSQDEYSGKDPQLEKVLEDSKRYAVRFPLSGFLFMLVQACLWLPMPAIAYPGQHRLPFVQHDWSGNGSYRFYEMSYALQCCSAFWLGKISIVLDCQFVAVMVLVTAQLKILAVRMENLRTEAKSITEYRICNDKSPEVEYDCKMYKDLRRCIESHQEILRFVSCLQQVMSPLAMTQFICSVIVICVVLFQATYSQDFATVLKCVAFLPVPCGQVFIYCWAADNMTEQAKAVSNAAYHCSWVDAGSRFKRTLLLVIGRAQRRLVLTAGHLYTIDRAAFLSVGVRVISHLCYV
ncbi:odorant receptor 42a-like [Schistocerca cancellata]|uniref:odorant receptor 42a-like n=1 Tax=Schistocerca cancellata TaxID=274614 RepID=UPI002118A15C|nr:odorant receptor 42a-like [Schistocerca cancellata]